MARSSLACVKRVVLTVGGKPTGCGKYQESKARNLQPKLVGDAGEVLQRRTRTAHHRTQHPAAFYVFSRDTGGYA